MENLSTEQPRTQRLNAAQLKALAMVIMLIDHIGAFLLSPDSATYPVCRTVGRLAFPIFCFLIAEGARHTRSLPKYMGRLLLFAVVSTPPYNLVHRDAWYSLEKLNVFFTLLLGLAATASLQKIAPRMLRTLGRNDLAASQSACALLGLPLCIALYFTAYALNTDYGGYGVAAILIFWLLREHPLAGWSGFALLTFVCYDLALLQPGGIYVAMNPYSLLAGRVWEGGCEWVFLNARQMAAVFAAIPCARYNGERGRLLPSESPYEKYLFYAFYPAHLLVIWLVQIFLK